MNWQPLDYTFTTSYICTMIEFYEGTIYTIVVKKTEIKVIFDHPTETGKQITCVILFN